MVCANITLPGSSWKVVSIHINSLDSRYSLTSQKCHSSEPLEISCLEFWVPDIFLYWSPGVAHGGVHWPFLLYDISGTWAPFILEFYHLLGS